MEGAANDLLLEIFIEGRPLIEDRQAIDGDAAGHHLVAGNGDEVTAIVAPVGGEVDDPPLGPVGGCHQHRGGKSERVADGGAALRQTAPEIADPLGKVLRGFSGIEHRPGQGEELVLVIRPLHQRDRDAPGRTPLYGGVDVAAAKGIGKALDLEAELGGIDAV
jgi:hypothetical protein